MRLNKLVFSSFLVALTLAVCYLFGSFLLSEKNDVEFQSQSTQSSIISSNDMLDDSPQGVESQAFSDPQLTVYVYYETNTGVSQTYSCGSTGGSLNLKWKIVSGLSGTDYDMDVTSSRKGVFGNGTLNADRWFDYKYSISTGYYAPIICSSVTSSSYTTGTPSGVTSTSASGNYSGYNGQIKFTTTTSIYFLFKQQTYTVSITSNNRSYGTVNPTSLTVGYGTTITSSGSSSGGLLKISGYNVCSATPQNGCEFDSWSGSSWTIYSATTITANFKQIPYYTVSFAVNSSCSGYGTVNSNSCSVQSGTTYSVSGSTVTVGSITCTANPNTGYEFTGWNYSSGTGTVTGDMTFEASFSAIKLTITFSSGSVTATNSISNQTAYFYSGASLTLPSGFTSDTHNFSNWSCAGSTYSAGTTVSSSVIKSWYDYYGKTITVTANWTQKQTGYINLSSSSISTTYPTTATVTVISSHGGDLSISANSNSNVATANLSETTITITPGTSAGQTTITVACGATSTYAKATATISVTNSLGTISYTASGVTCDYDGNNHSISVNVTSPSGTTVTYSENQSSGYSTTNISKKDVGEYPIWFNITLAGYNTVTDSRTITINAVDFSCSASISGTVRYEEELTASVTISDKVLSSDYPSSITYTWFSNANNSTSGSGVTQLAQSTSTLLTCSYILNVDNLIGKYIYVVVEIQMNNYNNNSCTAITTTQVARANPNISLSNTSKTVTYKETQSVSLTGKGITNVSFTFVEENASHFLSAVYTAGSNSSIGGTITLGCLAVENRVDTITVNVNVTVNDNYEPQTAQAITVTLQKANLPTPQNVSVSNSGVITWNNVTANDTLEGVSYEISFDGITYIAGTSGTNYYEQITGGTGTRTAYVRAVDSKGNYNTPSGVGSNSVTVYNVDVDYELAHNHDASYDNIYDDKITFTGAGNYISGATVQVGITINTTDILAWSTYGYWNITSNTTRNFSVTVNSNLHYTAHLKLDEIIVKFVQEEYNSELLGTTISNQYEIRNHTITEPTELGTAVGWEFFAWYVDVSRENAWDFETSLDQNLSQQGFTTIGSEEGLPTVTLYAHWEPIEYTVTYVAVNQNDNSVVNNNLTGTGNPTQVNITSSAYTLQSITLEGYDFVAWYTEQTCETQITELNSTLLAFGDEDNVIKIYAGLTLETFDITYYNNYTPTTSSTDTKEYDISYTILGCTFTAPDEKVFDSWNTKTDGTGTKYAIGSTYAINDDLELYAQWVDKTYTITFHTNSTTDATFSVQKTSNHDFDIPNCEIVNVATNSYKIQNTTSCIFGSDTTFIAPTAKHFSHWNTQQDDNGTSYSSGDKYELNSVLVLYAIWDNNNYYIQFDGNTNTSGTMSTQSITYGTPFTISQNAFLKTGYDFLGWAIEANGEVNFSDQEEITDFSLFEDLAQNGTKTFYAKWTPITYTISFVAGDGTGSMASQTLTYDKSEKLSKCLFTNTNYHFSQWKTTIAGVDSYYTDEQEVLNLVTKSKTLAFTAQWLPNVYDIDYVLYVPSQWERKEFKPTWKSGYTATTTYTFGVGLSNLPNAENVACLGYSFNGWFGDSGFSGSQITAILPSDFGTQTLYAMWTANTNTRFSVEYYCQSTSLSSDHSTYTLHSSDTENFTGTTDTQTNVLAKDIQGFTAEDITQQNIKGDGSTVVAVYYNRNQYTLSLDANGGIYNAGYTPPTSYYYGVEISLPTSSNISKNGYDFANWFDSVFDYEITTTTEFIGNQSFILHWNPRSDNYYKIYHFFENTDGIFEIDLSKTQEFTNGTTDASVSVNILSGENLTHGFEFDSTNENNVLGGTVKVDGSLVLKAYYARIVYAVSWLDGDNNTLKQANIKFGLPMEYDGETPTKSSTVEYVYAFDETWTEFEDYDNKIKTFTANFTQSARKYTVSLQIDNLGFGKLLFEGNLRENFSVEADYNSQIKFENGKLLVGETLEIVPTPTENTKQYSYAFVNFLRDNAVLTTFDLKNDVTIVASFSQTLNCYTITINNQNSEYGTVDVESVSNIPYGSLITVTDNILTINTTPRTTITATPKANDVNFRYNFDGWENVPEFVEDTLTIHAKFARVNQYYKVQFVVNNEEYGIVDVLEIENILYDTAITTNDNTISFGDAIVTATPIQIAGHTTTFAGWQFEDDTVRTDLVVTANFNRVVNNYSITWKNGDVVLQIDENVPYGTLPNYTGETPTKVSTQRYDFVFTGWSPTVETVSGDAIYSACFIDQKRKYNLTLIENGGTFVASYSKPTSFEWEEDFNLPNATQIKKDGFYLVGWTKTNDSADKDYCYYIPANSFEDKTYYACWKEKTSENPCFEFAMQYNVMSDLTSLFINASVAGGFVLLTVEDEFSMELNAYATKQIALNPKIEFIIKKDYNFPTAKVLKSNIKNIITVFDFEFNNLSINNNIGASVKYNLTDKTAKLKPLVYSVENNGNKTQLNSTLDDKTLKFSANDFSCSFVVCSLNSADEEEGSSVILIIAIVGGSCLVLFGGYVLIRKLKGKVFENKSNQQSSKVFEKQLISEEERKKNLEEN